MEEKHWSADEFLARLYGVGPLNAHLETCAECRARLEALQLRRESLRAGIPELPAGFLARQRQAIYYRLEGRALWMPLQPASLLAAVLLAFVIMTVLRPAPPGLAPDTTSDAEVFEEVFAVATSAEPIAVEPVRSLFEVQQ